MNTCWFQYWFAKGGSHFVGMIISPYSPQNASVISDIRCLTIGDDVAKEFLCSKYFFTLQFENVLLAMMHRLYHNCKMMHRLYHNRSLMFHLLYLSKH